MDTNDKDRDIKEDTPEQKEETKQPAEEGQNSQSDAKSYWKETPFDEMQHVKPDSFAGLEAGNGNNDSKQNQQQKKNDSDAYWRPRSAANDSENKNQNRGNDDNHYRQNQNNMGQPGGPFKSKRNRIGVIIFAL